MAPVVDTAIALPSDAAGMNDSVPAEWSPVPDSVATPDAAAPPDSEPGPMADSLPMQ